MPLNILWKKVRFINAVYIRTLLKYWRHVRSCNRNFKVENYRFVCPECNKPSSKIIEGNELTIYKNIVEEPHLMQKLTNKAGAVL